MTEWVKRLQGYVKIRVWGFAPQRFINLCSNKGILLWNIEKQEDVYTMCIGLRSFYELRPIARKTKVRVVISERYGLPFFVPGMLRRKAFLAGLFLAVAFWLISSLFVWDIQVTGNYQVTDDVFYSFLEQEGIHTGMRRSELNIGELEKQIRRKFSQVTWTSGRLDGTRLVIEVKENDMSVPEVVQDAAGAGKDLVAECNGVITDMIVRCGVPKVSIGSEVAKGDILVEGRIPIYAEDGTVREYRPVTPDADIVLEHTGTFQKKYTGRQKTFYFIHFGDREWKPEKKMDFLQYDSVLEACPVKALEYLQIPCMVGRITYREYQKTEYYYTVSEAETVLQKKIMDFLETLDEKGVQIISKDVKIETKRAGWTAHGELLLREAAVSLVDSRAEDTGAEDLDRNED
jgi:similar to stage IV sporulation protein